MTIRVNWQGAIVSHVIRAAAMQGLLDAGEHILDEANKLVPHDEGTLMRSGTVSHNEGKLQVNVSYDTPYAARLHEHPEYRFQKGRQGKWLERTLQVRKEAVQLYIGNKIRSAAGG